MMKADAMLMFRVASCSVLVWLFCGVTGDAQAQILNKKEVLQRYDFWDNQDWDWYADNIPFFECPDNDITLTYYYRWELI
nr:hypothetical protein [Pirellula sp.]